MRKACVGKATGSCACKQAARFDIHDSLQLHCDAAKSFLRQAREPASVAQHWGTSRSYMPCWLSAPDFSLYSLNC